MEKILMGKIININSRLPILEDHYTEDEDPSPTHKQPWFPEDAGIFMRMFMVLGYSIIIPTMVLTGLTAIFLIVLFFGAFL
jgi:hypothetical protein